MDKPVSETNHVKNLKCRNTNQLRTNLKHLVARATEVCRVSSSNFSIIIAVLFNKKKVVYMSLHMYRAEGV